MTKGLVAALGAFVIVIAAVHTATAGGDPQQKCASAKIKLAGKKAACLLGLDSKAEASATTADTTKVQGCKDKFSAAYAKLDLKGGCATIGDSGGIETKVDTLRSTMNTDLAVCTGADPAGGPCRPRGRCSWWTGGGRPSSRCRRCPQWRRSQI